jgi:hypothetical protein
MAPMNIKRALIGFCLITVFYLAALIWADSRRQVFTGLPLLAAAMPVLVSASFVLYLLRYARWHWLLRRAGCQTPVGRGFLAYLSGFAFTATPGKVGELLRIRYLMPLGVLAVLVLASLFISRRDVFTFVTAFVVVFVGLIAVAAHRPGALTRVGALLCLRRAGKLARLVKPLRDGLTGCRL